MESSLLSLADSFVRTTLAGGGGWYPKSTAPFCIRRNCSGQWGEVTAGARGKARICTGPGWYKRPEIFQDLKGAFSSVALWFALVPGLPGRSRCPGASAAVWSCPLRRRSTAAGAQPPSYSSRQWPLRWGLGRCGADTWLVFASSRKGSSVLLQKKGSQIYSTACMTFTIIEVEVIIIPILQIRNQSLLKSYASISWNQNIVFLYHCVYLMTGCII